MIIIIDIRKHLEYYLYFLKKHNSSYDKYLISFTKYYKKLILSNKNLLSINVNDDNKSIISDIEKLYHTYKINKCINYKYFGNSYYSYNGLLIILNILGFTSNERKTDFLMNNNKDKHIILTNKKFKILIRTNINKDTVCTSTYVYQGNKYKLIGSFINISWYDNITLVKSYHKLVGLICDNDYYIYDSYNIITYDKWNHHNFNNYKENFYKDPVYKTQKIKSIYIETLIYILIN